MNDACMRYTAKHARSDPCPPAGENPRASHRGQGVSHAGRLRAAHLATTLLLVAALHSFLALGDTGPPGLLIRLGGR
jgi:hypothetical protein